MVTSCATKLTATCLYRYKCFTGKYTTHKIETNYILDKNGVLLHVLTSEDVDDVISCFFTIACLNSLFVYIIIFIYEFHFLVLKTIFCEQAK